MKLTWKRRFEIFLDAFGRVFDPFSRRPDPRRYQHLYRGRTAEGELRRASDAVMGDLDRVIKRERERLRREGKIL